MKLAMAATSSLFFLSRSVGAFSPSWATATSRRAAALSRPGTPPLPAAFATRAAQQHEVADVPATAASDELASAFNEQVTRELSASQLYLSASLWCSRRDLVGFESYMREESEEERGHATRLIDFANKRRFPLELEALDAPPANWGTVEELWEDLLRAEVDNTAALKRLADIADAERDHSLSALLDPFHMEQVESEDELRTILAKVRDEERTPGLLRQLDSELDPEAQPKSA